MSVYEIQRGETLDHTLYVRATTLVQSMYICLFFNNSSNNKGNKLWSILAIPFTVHFSMIMYYSFQFHLYVQSKNRPYFTIST